MTEKLLGRGIYVDTDELRRVAGVVGELADRLKGDRGQFSAGGQVSGDAFGVLSSAAATLSRYRQAHHDTLTNLDTLMRAVEKMSSNLKASADNYDVADQGRL